MKQTRMRVLILSILCFAMLRCGGTDTGNPATNDGQITGACDSYSPAAFTCPDNSLVYRDPNNSCEFFPCP